MLRILYTWFGPVPRNGELRSAYLLRLSAFAALNILPIGGLMFWGLMRYGEIIGEMTTAGDVVGGIFGFGLPLLLAMAVFGSIGCLVKALLLRLLKMDKVIDLEEESRFKHEDEP